MTAKIHIKRPFEYVKDGLLGIAPTGISPTFLRLDSWSPGAGFIPIISNKGINQIKKGNL